MANRKTRPFKFNPRSVVDALDGGQCDPGGCTALTNLIFDPANPFALSCRPAAIKKYNFSGLTDPGAVSIAYVVGNIAYGMIDGDKVETYDQPFAYNLATNTLVTVGGTQNAATLPLTQPTTGTWTPPTMALVGPILYVTHSGYVGGSSAFFGWIDTTNPAAPVYYGGNTATNALPSVPTAVSAFDGAAWLACINTIAFTDAGNNTPTMTNSLGVQVVTIGDSIPITGLAQMPVTTSTQGILQSLIAFKPNAIGMVTGASALGTLTVNIISSAIGTVAPRTVAIIADGLMFMANDGMRKIDKTGAISEPNKDLKIPFIYALTPSRASAAYNNNIYRITVQNGLANGTPLQEYWFDFRTNGWNGPHSFTQAMAVPYNNTFVVFSPSTAPALIMSDVVQSGYSVFTELSAEMAFLFQTAPMQDDGGMFEGSATLAVIDMQLPHVAQSYSFVASDVDNGVISTATITTSASGAIWDGFNWDGGIWTATSYGFERYNIPWINNLVFSRLVLQITGASLLNFKLSKSTIGNEPMQYVRQL